MSETPDLFLEYIRPVLAEIAGAPKAAAASDAASRA